MDNDAKLIATAGVAGAAMLASVFLFMKSGQNEDKISEAGATTSKQGSEIAVLKTAIATLTEDVRQLQLESTLNKEKTDAVEATVNEIIAVSPAIEKAMKLRKSRKLSQEKHHAFLENQKRLITEIFDSLDTDHDGFVTQSELKDAFEKHTHASKLLKGATHGTLSPGQYKKGTMGDDEIMACFTALAIDGGKKITKDEFFLKLYAEANIMKIFHDNDTDLDGCLDRDEFNNMMDNDPEIKYMFKMLSSHNSDFYLFEQFDLDGDGKVSAIEFSKKMHIAPALVAKFESIDTNGDGSVDGKELTKALEEDEAFVALLKKKHVNPGKLVKSLDFDGDGEVSLTEFVNRLSR